MNVDCTFSCLTYTQICAVTVCLHKHLGSKSLPHLTVCAGISASLCVLRSVVPEKTHHQLSWGITLRHTHTHRGKQAWPYVPPVIHQYTCTTVSHHNLPPSPDLFLPVLGSSHSADILATYGRDFFLGPDRSNTESLTRITSPSLSTPS